MKQATYFDKYDEAGAYHWLECDRRLSNWKQYNPALDARYEVVVKAVQNISAATARMLDVGCGDGMLLARLSPLMQALTGVDSEANAIKFAQEKLSSLKNCTAIHTTCYDLPFDESEFDVVTSTDVIEHLKDPNHHLSEIIRVLKPNGTLVLTTPKWRSSGKWDLRHEKEYKPEELSSLLSVYFSKVELSYFWPSYYSRIYSTRLGWRFLKLASLLFRNPFLGEGSKAENFGQILAICRMPRPRSVRTTEL